MKRLALVALLLLGCGGEYEAADACEVATNDGTAVRCFNPHGICYVGLDGVGACQCNGDDDREVSLLCSETLGYAAGGQR